MTIIALTLTLLLAAWMAWRGWLRGATGTLAAWFPVLALSAILLLGLWLALSHLAHLFLISAITLALATAALIACLLLRRHWRLRVAARASSCPDPQPAIRNPKSLLAFANRLGGALLGLIAAALLSLALACLASAIPFALSARSAPGGELAAPPRWAEQLGRACAAVADLTTFGLLDHVPCLATYARDVRALVIILNAPRERLVRLARTHGFAGLADLPEVHDALADEVYLDLLDRLGNGDLGALQAIARHEATRRLLACPQVREVTRRLTLAQLAQDLSAPRGQ